MANWGEACYDKGMAEIKLNKKEEKELFFKALLGSPFFNIFASVLATFIVGAIFMKIGGGVPISVTQTSVTKTSTFDVEGEGKVVVVPDIAVVWLGVEGDGKDVARLQAKVNSKLNQLESKLRDLGIKKEDIKTVGYNIYPDYEKKGNFRVSARLKVTIREMSKVGRVMDVAGQFGLNEVSGPDFELSAEKKEKALAEARKEAVGKAKEKAKELAKLVGMRLGKIVNVDEKVDGWPNLWARDFEPIQALNSGRENKTSIEPGTSEVKVRVVVSWEVE